jgi:hypothetical protein
VKLPEFLTSVEDGDEWLASRSGRAIPEESMRGQPMWTRWRRHISLRLLGIEAQPSGRSFPLCSSRWLHGSNFIIKANRFLYLSLLLVSNLIYYLSAQRSVLCPHLHLSFAFFPAHFLRPLAHLLARPLTAYSIQNTQFLDSVFTITQC